MIFYYAAHLGCLREWLGGEPSSLYTEQLAREGVAAEPARD